MSTKIRADPEIAESVSSISSIRDLSFVDRDHIKDQLAKIEYLRRYKAGREEVLGVIQFEIERLEKEILKMEQKFLTNL